MKKAKNLDLDEVKPFHSDKWGWRLSCKPLNKITYVPKGSHAEKFLDSIKNKARR